MSTPFFSVVMAVQNGLPYLEPAIQSLLSQTCGDFELIVVDDHSTDATPAYLHSLKDSRMRIFENPDRGQTTGLNFGIRQATGPWIVRMDGDDWCESTRLERQRDAIAKAPAGTVMATSDYFICDEDLTPVAPVRLFPPNPALKHYLDRRNNPFCHPTVTFHRDTAQAVGLYDASIKNAQDYHLWHRLLAKGTWTHVPEILLKYRVRRGSLSVLYQPEQTTEKGLILGGRTPASASGTRASGNANQVEATYHYKLGFAAWLAGRRRLLLDHLGRSIRSDKIFRLKSLALVMMAMLLPRKLYLMLGGYRHVYR